MSKRGILCNEPSLTQQSAKDECDINLIVESAKRGADISHLSKGTPMYGDFTGLPSYRESLLVINKARDMFGSMDAFVRERFANDPARLLDFLENPANYEEGLKLGLLAPRPVSKPDDPLAGFPPLESTSGGVVDPFKGGSGAKKAKPKGDAE